MDSVQPKDSRDVVFYEESFPYAPHEKDSSEENTSPTFSLDFCSVEEDITSNNDGQQDQIIISNKPREKQVETNSDVIIEVEEPQNKGESEIMTNIDMGPRNRQPPKRLDDYYCY